MDSFCGDPWQSLNVVLDLSLNLKLCDFGLTESMVGRRSLCPCNRSFLFSPLRGLSRQERTHITKKNNGGSPRYMAPEVSESKVLSAWSHVEFFCSRKLSGSRLTKLWCLQWYHPHAADESR